jgi:hypothetical protein
MINISGDVLLQLITMHQVLQGSNKGPSNPEYLKIVQDRTDSFLVHNPGVKKEEIPADLVTASGSGLRSGYIACISLYTGKTYCNCSRNSRRQNKIIGGSTY